MKKQSDPRNIKTYFRKEKHNLAVIALTGVLCSIGLLAAPWFEGQLAQTMYDIFHQNKTASDLGVLATIYVLAIALVQALCYCKRLYIGKFAGNLSLTFKERIYRTLLQHKQTEDAGMHMTGSIDDAQECADGMKNFVTALLDTGLGMIVYLIMLFFYDWRLSLLVCLFPPMAYMLASKLQKRAAAVAAEAANSKKHLHAGMTERITNALLYRVFGLEKERNQTLEADLDDYEKAAIFSDIHANSPQPVYLAISMIGVIFIIWLGGMNVVGDGWRIWNIAAFSTYLTCFTRMIVVSSKTDELFHSAHQARSAWKKIRPYLGYEMKPQMPSSVTAGSLEVEHVSFAYPNKKPIYRELSFLAQPGEIIGITGDRGCGKTTLGLTFLCEHPYRGKILFDGVELSEYYKDQEPSIVGYLSRNRELFTGTIEENICLGVYGDIMPVIKDVCLDEDIAALPDGIKTKIGDGGIRLSTDQQARLALARTLYHARPILILDDPFAGVDRSKEEEILTRLRARYRDRIILIISRHLTFFPQLDQVLFMENGTVTTSNHVHLAAFSTAYRSLFEQQAEDITGEIPIRQAADRKQENLSSSASELAKILSGFKDRHRIYKSLHRMLKQYPLLMLTTLVSILVSVFISVLPPLILATALNRIAAGRSGLLQPALLYFLLVALSFLTASVREVFIRLFGQRASHALRSDMNDKLSRIHAGYFVLHKSDSITEHFIEDIHALETLLTSGVLSMITDCFSMIAILGMVFRMSRGLGVLLLISMPIIFMLTRIFQNRSHEAQLEHKEAHRYANQQIPETTQNRRTIRLLHCESYLIRRYHRLLRKSYTAMNTVHFYQSIYSPLIQIISAFLIADMMILSVSSSSMGRIFGMSVGTVVALISYVNRIFDPLARIGTEFGHIQSALASLHRIRLFLEEEEKSDVLQPIAGEDFLSSPVDVSHLTFGYDNTLPVLEDLNLRMQNNEHLVISGGSGSGKSTLMHLILGLYEPQDGYIRIYNTDPTLIPDAQKRKIFGYVEQQFSPVIGTIRDQITLGDPHISDKQIEAVLELTSLREPFAALPRGLDTPYHSALLSNNEKQLLSIARACVAGPRILLLDEITSGSDERTDESILYALDRVSTNRTVVSISQRFREIQGAKRLQLPDLQKQKQLPAN